MRVSHGGNQDHFDLLPFISVLMTTLGCLFLITLTIAALYLGASAKEGWIPDTSSKAMAKKPILVEWDGVTAIFHLGKRKVAGKWQPRGGRDPEFDAAMKELIDARSTHYALIAVRPSGFETFRGLIQQFRDRRVEIGYEPIAQDRSVRLLDKR